MIDQRAEVEKSLRNLGLWTGIPGPDIVAALAAATAIASRFGPENLRPIARWLGCCAHLRPKARKKPENRRLILKTARRKLPA